MYKIGEFSIMSKTTIKTLRYYEQEKLLVPAFVSKDNGYRFYDTSQLVDLNRIISLRQIGLSIKDIKRILNGANKTEILEKRRKEINDSISIYNIELTKVNYLLEEENMNNEITLKQIPAYTVYYKEGVIKDFSELTNFIISSGDECLKDNPDIKCIASDYCYINYLDGEYKDKDIKIRYVQAVEEAGTPNETIKFMKLEPVLVASIYHKGPYTNIRKAYGTIIKYTEDNGYEIIDFPRECYIDGMWNKDNENDWLTEIQVPVRKNEDK